MPENSYHCVRQAESPSSVGGGKPPSAFPWKPSFYLPLTPLSLSLFPFPFISPFLPFSPHPYQGRIKSLSASAPVTDFPIVAPKGPLYGEFLEFRKFLIIPNNWINKWLASTDVHFTRYRENPRLRASAASRDCKYLLSFRVLRALNPPLFHSLLFSRFLSYARRGIICLSQLVPRRWYRPTCYTPLAVLHSLLFGSSGGLSSALQPSSTPPSYTPSFQRSRTPALHYYAPLR